MGEKDIILSDLSNEELNSIFGGGVRLVSVYRDGKLVIITYVNS